MSGPFNVLPNSLAERAVNEVAALDFSDIATVPLSSKISPILDKYGVDPVTQSAVEAAADSLASRPETNISELAQGLIGSAVSDPRVAGNQAKLSVEEGQPGLTDEQQEEAAITAAGDAAEDAGADRSVAEREAKDALSQGVSPAMAAYAGAAIAVTAAVSANPAANPGIEIFGYLKALVTGMVRETYLKEENKDVKLKTTWTIGGDFIQTTSSEFKVICKDYFAEAESDSAESDSSSGDYKKGYRMECPAPNFTRVASWSVAWAKADSRYQKISSMAAYKLTIFGVDCYAAILGTARRNVTDEKVQERKDKYLIGIHSRSRTNFS